MKNKLTKKQLKELDELSYDAYEFVGRMLTKIEKKTKEGVKGWNKMPQDLLCEKACERLCVATEMDNKDYKQILDAANYLLFAWLKAGKP